MELARARHVEELAISTAAVGKAQAAAQDAAVAASAARSAAAGTRGMTLPNASVRDFRCTFSSRFTVFLDFSVILRGFSLEFGLTFGEKRLIVRWSRCQCPLREGLGARAAAGTARWLADLASITTTL